jgi:hypothetical protein
MSFFSNALAFAGNATVGAVSAAVSVAGCQDSVNLQVFVSIYFIFSDTSSADALFLAPTL